MGSFKFPWYILRFFTSLIQLIGIFHSLIVFFLFSLMLACFYSANFGPNQFSGNLNQRKVRGAPFYNGWYILISSLIYLIVKSFIKNWKEHFHLQPPKYLNINSTYCMCIVHARLNVNTLGVFKFAQYYFSRTPTCANLSTARIIVRAKSSNISNLKNL